MRNALVINIEIRAMKKEIENIDDIKLLVDEFYKKVLLDKTIAHFFNDVAKVDWEKHLPVMYSFWTTLLFGTMGYKGNPMIKHLELNKKENLHHEHFNQWLKLWRETIDEFYVGEKAEEAKQKALNISSLMMNKIEAKDQDFNTPTVKFNIT